MAGDEVVVGSDVNFRKEGRRKAEGRTSRELRVGGT